MKTIKIVLFTVTVLLIGCNEESFNSEKTLSESILKIETSYIDGAEKIEGSTGGLKIETKLTGIPLKKFYEKIDKEITESLRDYEERYRIATTLFDGFDVGVIPSVNGCPTWSEKITIYMDCEDGDEATHWEDNPNISSDNYRGSWSVTSAGNLKMIYCRVDGRMFTEMVANNPTCTYAPAAVLRLGTNFLGTGIYQRVFDNEDNSNGNYSIGDIAPNVSNSNTTLYFVDLTDLGGPKSCVAQDYPDFGFSYGVLSATGLQWGWLKIDDEDSNNANRLRLNGQNVSSAHNYLLGGSNTQIFIGKKK